MKSKYCSLETCSSPYSARGYCTKHYTRYSRGIDPARLSREDHRPARIEGEIAYIPLGVDTSEFTIVDRDNANLDQFKWHKDKDGYAIGYSKGKHFKLHQIVLGESREDHVVDHINRDKLDNRKDNLRLVSYHVNSINHTISSRNTSGVAGVHWSKKDKSWIAKITARGVTTFLGLYPTLEQASRVREAAQLIYWKEESK
jgi:HNH endonuclease